jgi:hypothetical protein
MRGERVTLLAKSSQRKQKNVTPIHGLLFIPYLTELPPEGTVQQEGDYGNKSHTDQPHSTAERQNKDVRHEGQGWTAIEKGTPDERKTSLLSFIACKNIKIPCVNIK